tara:strand:+ start:126 stop:434 length:309 start_codon:yes stop_codon:yes gene_type:complete
MLTIVFYQDNNRKVYSVPEGLTILEVARKKNIDIEGSCQGSLACSTCHILISKKWINKIYPAKIEEKEMLGIIPNLKNNSRLGCQIKLTKSLDGLEIILPKK